MNAAKRPIQVEYKTLVIIWTALLMSQAVFLVVIYAVNPELFAFGNAGPLLGDQPLVVVVFAGMAMLVLLLSFVLRNQHLKRAVRDQDAGCVQTGLVLGCALSEISSILGVILALAFGYRYFFAWIVLGLLGILFHFPRKSNLDAVHGTI